MSMNRLLSIFASLMLGLAGCGGGSGGAAEPPPPPPAVTVAEAYQLLNQGSFGATEAEAQRVISMRQEAWIDDQMQQPASLQLPFLQSLPPPQMGMFELQRDRADIFFRNSLHGEDQLRQRVAFALSEIMVVSQLGALNDQPYSLASYYDMLTENAFGNYRDLIEDVTLHPAMGVYLSMLGNEKPNQTLNIRPDENYARELMQLFSIGLVELNIDGSEKLDQGQPIPTYDQEIIEGFAHVYTGWTYAGAPRFQDVFPTPARQVLPMQHWPDFHDTGPKTLLNGITLPAGQSGEQDLSDALDNIFNHPNVGPFIAIRLIQRLVTSNPSPGYISRSAAVFNDNGAGVRGDLGAVVKAILLDDEARPAIPMELDGKVKEPLLRLTQLWRAYDATSESGRYPLNFAYIVFGQGPLQAPHVFNFFSPFFAPPGEIRNNNLVAPELEIATEYLNTYVTNYMFYQTFALNSTNTSLNEDDVYINFESEMLLAADIDMLIDSVANKLLAGQISDTLRNEIAGMLALIPETETALRAAETIYFIVTSPEYAYQR